MEIQPNFEVISQTYRKLSMQFGNVRGGIELSESESMRPSLVAPAFLPKHHTGASVLIVPYCPWRGRILHGHVSRIGNWGPTCRGKVSEIPRLGFFSVCYIANWCVSPESNAATIDGNNGFYHFTTNSLRLPVGGECRKGNLTCITNATSLRRISTGNLKKTRYYLLVPPQNLQQMDPCKIFSDCVDFSRRARSYSPFKKGGGKRSNGYGAGVN
ncbi:hypothetical protein N656DRAFT_771294 [Canariomyces notabilis]|uniref:Uncharacterized protein n=1 Tax=Canariomyces notabilis TaxID=2074819 RepID=A0AAN6QGD7_9PEZI|nr:hypothetical protein N656DRAFT_771294 [Canariomyces arenarius]